MNNLEVEMPDSENHNQLTGRPIPESVQSQLDAFTPESIRVAEHYAFDPTLNEGAAAIGIDIGGDSLAANAYVVEQGQLRLAEEIMSMVDIKGGRGYLAALKSVSDYAAQKEIPVGISFAGPVLGSQPLQGANVPELMTELADGYGGDFGKLFPTLRALENDAVAGLLAGAVHAQREQAAKNVIYLINGSGMNTSLLIDGVIYATESGHVPVVPELNPNNQRKACGLFGAEYTCVEAVAASKAGVEDIYEQLTGVHFDGKSISNNYQFGDEYAASLYDNSANVTAHVLRGVAQAMGIDLTDGQTAIVGHGGIFKVPDYGERLNQILTAHSGAYPPLYLTKDFSDNACLEGAAIAAMK